MKSYDQILEHLFRLNPTPGMKADLNTALELDKRLAFPSSSYPTIHVAGTNGKGSVATKIAKVLELCGYRVGIYTSPHLLCFRERIAIGDVLISEQEVVEGFEKISALLEGLTPTFFEWTTFLAFDHFHKRNVDVAVIETGLGGRFDATNVVHPLLSIITSISREHSELLGEEIEMIAAEKAGIIKEATPVILGPKARCQSIYDRAKQMGAPVFVSKKISYFFDEENTALAALSLEHLNSRFDIDEEALREGLLVRPPCRFERIGDAIFDVAHNPEAIFCLLQALHTFFPHGKFRFLTGFSKDKEYDRCLELIADVATHVHLVQSASLRAASVEELKQAMKEEDPQLFTGHASISEAVAAAYTEALSRGEMLVICGSFYIMAEAKNQCALNETILPAGFSSAVN